MHRTYPSYRCRSEAFVKWDEKLHAIDFENPNMAKGLILFEIPPAPMKKLTEMSAGTISEERKCNRRRTAIPLNQTQPIHLKAHKSLSQNFLTDPVVIKDMMEQVLRACAPVNLQQLTPKIFEIGPGQGALTLAFLKRDLSVLALEKDPRAVQGLRQQLGQHPTFKNLFTVIEGDILRWNPPQDQLPYILPNQSWICFGNIPYAITTDIFLWFCTFANYYTHGFFLVQKEVAERITARPGTKAYGRLTARLQLFFNIASHFTVPATAFAPKPEVDSAFIELQPKGFDFTDQKEEKIFEQLTAFLFSARRKMLRKTLEAFIQQNKNPHEANQLLAKLWDTLAIRWNIQPTDRPECLPPEALLVLTQALTTPPKSV